MRDISVTISIDCTMLKILQENSYLMTEISAMKDVLPHVVDEKRSLQFALSEQNARLHQELNRLKGANL